MSAPDSHERLAPEDPVRVGSDRSFGFVMAGALLVIAALRWWHDADATWFVVAAAGFAVPALVWPRALRPLNWLWFRFGLLLHAVTTPVILGLMFFVVITPTGWLMRAFGKRPLALRFDPRAESYWIHRQPPGPSRDSLPNQF